MGITAYTVLPVFCLHIIRDKYVIITIIGNFYSTNAIHKL